MFHALPRWTNKNLDEQNREKDYSISLSFVWSQRTATPLPPQAVTMAAVSSMVSRRPSGSELAAHAASAAVNRGPGLAEGAGDAAARASGLQPLR